MQDSPPALEGLLSAGTLSLRLVQTHAAQNGSLGEGDWGVNTSIDGLPLADAASQQTKKELDFLVETKYVRARWRHNPIEGRIHVRVYLVPKVNRSGGLSRAVLDGSCHDKLVNVQKALRSLLWKTDRCVHAWSKFNANVTISEPFMRPPSDERTLFDIFNNLPSPEVDASTFLSGTSMGVRKSLEDALHWEAPPGMQRLYPYQRRTVARLLQQELDPGMAPDPLYIPVRGVSGDKTFYVQPTTLEILYERPMQAQARGGILCEDMGTGKTCMVLALIMATKHQLSTPEEAPVGVPEGTAAVLTPLAFTRFPSSQFKHARSAARVADCQQSVPPLVEILIHYIRTWPDQLGNSNGRIEKNLQLWETLVHQKLHKKPALWKSLVQNHPFYHLYQPSENRISPRRANPGFRKMYLTSATLIVVPRSILTQWRAEIAKHCGNEGLICLTIEGNQTQLPPVKDLASKYDVILITHERFAEERRGGRYDLSKLYTWEHCVCQDLSERDSNSFICKPCTLFKTVTPLVQIRWKRLVVDEGNHIAAPATDLAVLAKDLSVERRWIVSGTPTQNLIGLSLGQSHLHALELLYPDDPDDASELDSEASHNPTQNSSWSKEKKDVERLGDMMVKFLHVPQFASVQHHVSFRKMVSEPLCGDKGYPKYGAIKVLVQVMEQIMFRHQIHIIEQELDGILPSVIEETVTLPFHPLAAKTYNVQLSLIALNAVDSERSGRDYLIHSGNSDDLSQTLENLTQAMFWRTDSSLISNMYDAIGRSGDILERSRSSRGSASDIKLIEDSIRVLRDAAGDEVWRKIMLHMDSELPFVVHGLSPSLGIAWGKITSSRAYGMSLLNPQRIIALRKRLVKLPLMSDVADAEKKADDDRTSSMPLSDRNPSHSWSLHSLKIGYSLSSKANFILREVLEHSPNEKFVIFSAYPLSLDFLAQALRLVQIQYRKYLHHKMTPEDRKRNLEMFENSIKHRVLLMELKLGARGLNIVTASRIIFCEPVLEADLESQAIKRCQRIGQKSEEIKVCTLVTQGTWEADVETRRQGLRRRTQLNNSQLPPPKDADLKEFIKVLINYYLLFGGDGTALHGSEWSATGTSVLDIPLLPQPPISPGPMDHERVVSSPQAGDTHFDPSRPSLRVRFVSPLESGEVQESPKKKRKYGKSNVFA